MNKTLFQVLEDRNNPREVETHGPYKCTRSDAWLGDGYYFGESFIELATSWGKNSYHGCYMICEMVFPYSRKKIFDLTGENAEQLSDFRSYFQELVEKSGKKYTVAGVIEHMKRHADLAEEYIAVRVRDSRQGGPSIFFRFSKEYMELEPRIQLCFFSNNAFRGLEYKVVFPKKYVTEDQLI